MTNNAVTSYSGYILPLLLAKSPLPHYNQDKSKPRENNKMKETDMYNHHEESIKIMTDYFKKQEDVIALILGGSVAKGMERPDSDLDAMVVVTPGRYERHMAEGTLSECIYGWCTYEGGYFDVKYITKHFLEAAARAASEPTRNAFVSSRVLFTRDEDITGYVRQIPLFQQKEKDDKMLSFYSDLSLNYNYFWKICRPSGYMKLHTAAEIIYACCRMVLQINETLFPSNRRLEETAARAANKPEGFMELCREFEDSLSDEACDRLVDAFLKWLPYPVPQELSAVLSRYEADFEQWWLNPRPFISEW